MMTTVAHTELVYIKCIQCLPDSSCSYIKFYDSSTNGQFM